MVGGVGIGPAARMPRRHEKWTGVAQWIPPLPKAAPSAYSAENLKTFIVHFPMNPPIADRKILSDKGQLLASKIAESGVGGVLDILASIAAGTE